MSLTDSQLYELYKEHWNLYSMEDKQGTFLFRELTRKEYREIIDIVPDELDREEYVCKICVIDPPNFDYENSKGALVTNLSKRILIESGFSSINTGKINSLTEKYMEEMNSFQHQISCIISEAFPNLDLEEIESFNLEKTLWYYSRAKYKLEALRGIPLVNANAQAQPQHNQQMAEHMRQVQSQANYEEMDLEPMNMQTQNKMQMQIDGDAGGADAPELAMMRRFMQGKNI